MTRHLLTATALAALLTALPAAAQEMRIGLGDDADILDPDQSRTFVGRCQQGICIRADVRDHPAHDACMPNIQGQRLG